MANPPPPLATYPAMGTRAGYADTEVLTTAELNQACAYLVAQDGNGNVQQIVSLRVGPNAFLAADPSGNAWYTFNAYYDTGTSAWYPVNSAVASYGLEIAATGLLITTAPAVGGVGALTWSTIATFSSSANLNTVLATLTSLASSISTNATAIAAETSRAEGVEASLSSSISSEATTRAAADATLATEITTEATARATAVAAETTRAEAAEATLGTAITTEATARTAAIAVETARAEAAESGLSASVTSEASTRAAADTALAASVASEATARAAAVSAETTRAEAAEAALGTSITGAVAVETAARIAAVTAEMNRAEGAEAALSTSLLQTSSALAYEVGRAQYAEGGLQGQISALKTIAQGNYASGGPASTATTGALPSNYYDAANQVLIGLSTTALPAIDGVSPTVGMRILVKNEAAAANNGLYVMTQQSNGTTTPWILQRASDANTAALLANIIVFVLPGASVNGGATFVLPLSAGQITIGTTALNFIKTVPMAQIVEAESYGVQFQTGVTQATIANDAAVQDIVSDCVAKGGLIVLCPAGIAGLNDQILIENVSGLLFIGVGQSLTSFQRLSAGTSNPVFWQQTGSATNIKMTGGGFQQLTVDGNGVANYGRRKTSVDWDITENVTIQNCLLWCDYWDGSTTLQSGVDSGANNQHYCYINVYINQQNQYGSVADGKASMSAWTGCGVNFGGTPNGHGDTSLGLIEGLRVNIRNGHGAVFSSADTNTLNGLFCFQPAPVTGTGTSDETITITFSGGVPAGVKAGNICIGVDNATGNTITYGDNVLTNTYVQSVGATTVTLNNATIGNSSGATFTFEPAGSALVLCDDPTGGVSNAFGPCFARNNYFTAIETSKANILAMDSAPYYSFTANLLPVFSLTTTGTTTASSNTLTNVANVTGLLAGHAVNVADVPTGTIVESISGTGPYSVVMSNVATGPGNVGESITFDNSALTNVSSFANLVVGQHAYGRGIRVNLTGTLITALNPGAGVLTLSAAPIIDIALTGVACQASIGAPSYGNQISGLILSNSGAINLPIVQSRAQLPFTSSASSVGLGAQVHVAIDGQGTVESNDGSLNNLRSWGLTHAYNAFSNVGNNIRVFNNYGGDWTLGVNKTSGNLNFTNNGMGTGLVYPNQPGTLYATGTIAYTADDTAQHTLQMYNMPANTWNSGKITIRASGPINAAGTIIGKLGGSMTIQNTGSTATSGFYSIEIESVWVSQSSQSFRAVYIDDTITVVKSGVGALNLAAAVTCLVTGQNNAAGVNSIGCQQMTVDYSPTPPTS